MWKKIKVSSFSQLESELNKLIQKGLKSIGKSGEKTVKEQIQKQVYAKYLPSDSDVSYERTFGLLNSVVMKHEGNTISIFHEGMSGYESVVKGYTANSDLIPDLIHVGAPNIFRGGASNPAWSKPRDYIDISRQIIEKEANSVFNKIFK